MFSDRAGSPWIPWDPWIPWAAWVPFVLALFLSPPEPIMAQTMSVTPTIQASVAEYDQLVPGMEYRSYGLMLGTERPGHWWSPHVWFQRYELTSVCPEVLPDGRGCSNDGWSLSVGPAIEFLDSDRWTGRMIPQMGFTSRSDGDFTGGAGLHFGVKAGAFQPQAFGRFQTQRQGTFLTIGVGVRFEFGFGDPDGKRGSGPFGQEEDR